MSNPTSNFNWQMPTATDLVTDLPADFEVFGQAVDTSLADLKGGTAGQILAKNTNTDMDFVWVTNDVGDITAVTAGTGISGGGTSGAVTITNSMATEITAKADLIVGTGNAAFDNLPVGANGTVLTADSTVSPTGLKWATPASGSMTLLSTTAITAAASLTLSSISGSYTHLYLLVTALNEVSGGSTNVQFNGVTSASYRWNRTRSDTATASNDNAATSFPISFSGAPNMSNALWVYNYTNTATGKNLFSIYNGTYAAGDIVGGFVNNSAINEIKINWGGTPAASGNVYLYGVN
jgi:hypothetical protein